MLSLSAYAAEEGDNSEIENEQATTAAEPGEASGTVEALPDIGLIEEAEEAETQQGGDTDFIPSVRITEDLPVAFPVDI